MALRAVGVSLEGHYFLLDDDTTLPIVCMIDIDGDETANPDSCVIAIFKLPNGRFSGHDVREFDDDMRIKRSG
jgi:hypothetical protein